MNFEIILNSILCNIPTESHLMNNSKHKNDIFLDNQNRAKERRKKPV